MTKMEFCPFDISLQQSDLLASARHGVNVDYKWGEYLMCMYGWYKRRDAVGVCTTFIQNLK